MRPRLSCLGLNASGDQSEKRPASMSEQPAEMDCASLALSEPPDVIRKPGIGGVRWTAHRAAQRFTITAQVETEIMRVGEMVVVTAGHFDAVIDVADHVSAAGAVDV